MSKASKTKSKEKRKKDKAARKAAQTAIYVGYMKQGTNGKSKRSRKKSLGAGISAMSHPDGKCGNMGCIKCFGIYFRPFLSKGEPLNMPNWMWLKWDKLDKTEKKKYKNSSTPFMLT